MNLYWAVILIALVGPVAIGVSVVLLKFCLGFKVGRIEVLPVRANILLIASFLFVVSVAIVFLIGGALMKNGAPSGDEKFIIGTLIGLLGSGITGLAGLGTTLVSDSVGSVRPDDSDEPKNENSSNQG